MFGKTSTYNMDPVGILSIPTLDNAHVGSSYGGWAVDPESYIKALKYDYSKGEVRASAILQHLGNYLREKHLDWAHELEIAVLKSAGDKLLRYENISRQNDEIRRNNAIARKTGGQTKPLIKQNFSANELYRLHHEALRWIATSDNPSNSAKAKSIIRDLSLLATLPFGELEAPDWIDSYTGEVIDEAQEAALIMNVPLQTADLAAAIPQKRKSEEALTLDRLRSDLGYTEEQIAQYIRAQEGYNSVADEIEIPYEDRSDFLEPTWMEIQNEITLSEYFHDLRVAFNPLRKDALSYATQLRDYWDKQIPKRKGHWADVMSHLHEAFYASQEAEAIINHLQELVSRGENPADIAALWYSVQNGLLFAESDAEKIKLGLSYTLFDWIEEFGNELLEHMNDSISSSNEVTFSQIEKFSAETLDLIEQSCVTNIPTKNIANHPAFVRAYVEAVCNSQSVTTKVDGNWKNSAIEAGWDAYREARSPKGNLAYWSAKKAGKPQKDCMRAFWAIVRKEESRAAIKGFNSQGLTLESGRKIDWRIALIKLKNDELRLNSDDKARLKNLLVEKGWGAEFCLAL